MTTENEIKSGMGNITEFEAKAILREYGIVTPRGIVFESLPDKIELKFPLVQEKLSPLATSFPRGLFLRTTESLSLSMYIWTGGSIARKYPSPA